MDSFGIDRLALPKFGIDVFRLPNFGQTSNGASKGRFHESLVDAWFMSGYKNDDAPSGIRGVKGNVITLHNFLFAGNSGFGKYAENYNDYNFQNIVGTSTHTSDTIHITEFLILRRRIVEKTKKSSNPCKVKISGLTDDIELLYIGNSAENELLELKLKNGVNELPAIYMNAGFSSGNYLGTCDITITQIPDNEGALCFDGVDDYAVLQNTGFTVDTVILGYYDYDKTSARWKYFYDANVVRTYAGLNVSQNFMAGSNNVDNTDKDGVVTVNYTKGTNMLSTPLYIGTKTELTEFMGMSLKYFAVYSEPLTTEKIEEEKVKLENKWESKLNKS